jgi:hypothetical protein
MVRDKFKVEMKYQTHPEAGSKYLFNSSKLRKPQPDGL